MANLYRIWAVAWALTASNVLAFQPCDKSRSWTSKGARNWVTTRANAVAVPNTNTDDRDQISETTTTAFSLALSGERAAETRTKSPPKLSRIKRKLLFWRNDRPLAPITNALDFTYDYDSLVLESSYAGYYKTLNTTGIVLVHPIGVGIGKWFYQRLSSCLREAFGAKMKNDGRLVVVTPDLLGSGSACNATTSSSDGNALAISKFPLLNISDWTDQVLDLMATVEKTESIDQWCIVANGGCSPIALQVAARSVTGTAGTKSNVTSVILSSVPRLPFFLERSNDPAKVAKSYKTLCGLPGKLFWWYACRNEGAFIQKFSEKNLFANPDSLGDEWRPNCYNTAKMNNGLSKYSTFAFLAGTLQDGCEQSLHALKDSNVCIDIIKGGDVRRNRAKSWFWQRRKASKGDDGIDVEKEASQTNKNETLRDYVQRNGNRGTEAVTKGRISLAHEDPEGYSNAILRFLQ